MSESQQTRTTERARQTAAAQAEAWEQLIPLRQRLYGAATTRMLAAARLKPGDQVLDIAAGTDDQSRQAVRAVGPAARGDRGASRGAVGCREESEVVAVASRIPQLSSRCTFRGRQRGWSRS